jgi:ABC-type lipoprotein export system ATPase subunit
VTTPEPVTGTGLPAAGFVNVVRIYQAASGEVHALRGVDADFPAGSVTAIAGPSGGGKSTLLSILALRDRASAGTVTLLGNDVTRARGATLKALRRKSIAWVPQRPSHGLLPHLSARDNLVQIAGIRGRSNGWSPDEALDLLGLASRAQARPGLLSGGEQQRLAVAAALMHAPDLIVADEPTAELDDPNADRVIAAFLAVAAQGTTCVISTHDGRALRHLPRVLHLRQGVLSAERSGTGEWAPGQVRAAEAVIDSAGRLQLPPDALRLFPGRRVAVRIENGAVILDPPTVADPLADLEPLAEPETAS